MFYVVLGCLICCSFLLCSRFCLVVFGRLSSVSCLRLFMFVLLFYIFHSSHRFRLLSEIYVVFGRVGCSTHFLLTDLSCYGCLGLY